MIVDTTYFDGGELNIPGTAQPATSETLNDFIQIYEPEFLQKALGYPLFKLFNAAINPGPVPVGRFKDLLDGNVEYTDGHNYTKLWTGLNTPLRSPISMYIWYWWQRKMASYSGPSGEQKGKTENAENVGVDTKQMQMWNKMNRVVCVLWEYLQYSKNPDGTKKYPEFDRCQTGRFGVLNQGNL
jgi:hypothetical protein